MEEIKIFEMLNEKNQDRVLKMFEGYAGSEGTAGRLQEMYEESASYAEETLEQHINSIHPNEYVEICWGEWEELN